MIALLPAGSAGGQRCLFYRIHSPPPKGEGNGETFFFCVFFPQGKQRKAVK